jgi:GNAT superfamily N-acetyltransferase
MLPNERTIVESIFARSLNLINRIVFQISFEDALRKAKRQKGATLVAELDGQIVGCVSVKIESIRGKPTGFIDALAADKDHRGKGVGKSLVSSASSWLEERGCGDIYATADRYNSPSWNIFVHLGFSVYDFPRQLRDYGLSFLRLWLVEFYFLAFGTFFLRRAQQKEEKPRKTHETRHFAVAWLGVSLGLWIPVILTGKPFSLLPLYSAVTAISILAHELSQKLAARRFGLETTFRIWESGLFVSILFGAVGSFFPAYGSTYVRKLDYRYEHSRKENGVFYATGPVASLILAYCFRLLTVFTGDILLTAAAKVGFTVNFLMVLFHLIPVQAAGGIVWDGKKILTWNKIVWLLLTLGTALLLAVDQLVLAYRGI